MGWTKTLVSMTAVVALAACGTLLGADEDASPPVENDTEAGAEEDGGADAPSVATGDAAFDAPPCPTGGRGPAMVLVSGVSSFCIDATEVTRAQYAAFLVDFQPSTTLEPFPCEQKTTYKPPILSPNCEGNLETTFPNRPVACVDYCDARKFCEWAGKRLCHAVPGEIESACSRFGAQPYPWGNDFGDGGCNVADYDAGGSVEVGTARRCEGGFPGIFDITGNLSEWEADCNPSGACNLHASSFTAIDDPFFRCSAQVGTDHGTNNDDLGFRCCADAK